MPVAMYFIVKTTENRLASGASPRTP